eukprot:scaffold13351_cov194-Alexandrium_tamarense.AAC.18
MYSECYYYTSVQAPPPAAPTASNIPFQFQEDHTATNEANCHCQSTSSKSPQYPRALPNLPIWQDGISPPMAFGPRWRMGGRRGGGV